MEQFKAFWDLVVEVWRTGVFGIDIGQIIIALTIFTVFLILRGLITRFVIGALKLRVGRTKTHIDDEVVEALEEPIRLLPIILGLFFALQFLQLDERMQDVSDKFLRSLISASIFWALYRAIKPLSGLLIKFESVLNAAMMEWVTRAARVLVAFIGFAAVLEIWGIQVGPILAGLGLFGVAVALGAQDLFKNLIAGILIIAERRFNKGDWIRVEGIVEGTVENIGFRSTMVRRFDKAPVHVPNTHLSDNPVTNFTAMTHRRIFWHIGLEYRTTLDQLKAVRERIETYIHESDEFASPEEVSTFVRIDRFSDSSIDIMLYCFTKTTVWAEWLEIKERLALHIKDVVETEGAGFAFPSQSVYLEKIPGEKPELFIPPTTAVEKKS